MGLTFDVLRGIGGSMREARGGVVWRTVGFCAATLLLWHAGSALAEGWRTAPLAAYVHAAWWGRGDQPDPAALLADPPGRADGRAWSGYAQAALAAARGMTDASAHERALDLAEAATRQALQLGPAQAATWARLALIAVNRGDTGLAAAALGRSLALAPNGTGLAWSRVKLGLYLWEHLDAGGRSGISSDLVRVWRQPPSGALPYPRVALQRYAATLGRSEVLTAVLPGVAGGDAG